MTAGKDRDATSRDRRDRVAGDRPDRARAARDVAKPDRRMPDPHEKPAVVRYVYLAAGFVNVGIGVVGAFLPVLPTTIFMIIALWCFARSSRRFHDWLYNHRVFGPPLRNWVEHGTIPRRAKIAAICAMAASLAIVVYLSENLGLAVLVALLMAVGAGYILSRPSTPPPPKA